jgi:hypothetical protein
MNRWFIIMAILSTCAIGLAVSPPESTNSPTIIRGTNQSSSVTSTTRTNNNGVLPPMYQGTISNLHDRVGTNAVNQGNDNPDPQPPHTPPE